MSTTVNAEREEWRPVPWFSGYEASSLGRIRSTKRTTAKVLRQHLGTQSRFEVTLYSDGGRCNAFVHKIIAHSFLGPQEPGVCVRHLDGDATNNCVENLAYGSYQDNYADAVRHGTRGAGTVNPLSHAQALDWSRVEEIRGAVGTQKEIARRYGISQTMVWKIKANKSWKQET